MRQVAVTGASGFLCANIVSRFASQGISVIACDLDSPPNVLSHAWSRLPGKVDPVRLDVGQENQWSVLDAFDIDTIVHGAAVTPPIPDTTPGRTLRVNVLGTLAALEYARRRSVRRFVYISSAAVYGGLGPRAKLSEQAVVRPKDSYSVSKFGAERLVSLYRNSYGLDGCSVRLTGLYGPWERPTRARGRLSVICTLATAALQNRQVRILGSTVKRECTFAGDVAAGIAHLCALEKLEFDLFNLSLGTMSSLREIVDVLHSLRPVTLARAGEPAVEISVGAAAQHRPLDNGQIRAAGFQATTGLRDGLASYLVWLQNEGAFLLCDSVDLEETIPHNG